MRFKERKWLLCPKKKEKSAKWVGKPKIKRDVNSKGHRE